MVKIKLPTPNDSDYAGKNIKSFIRQLELAVHHLRKSYEQLESDGLISEDSFIIYRFPVIGDLYDRVQDDEGNVNVHVDEQYGGFQEIEIEIAD